MARQLQQVAAFLRRLLAQGPLPSQHVWEQVQQAGYSKRTYERARSVLRVQATRSGYGGMGWWVVSLPPAKAQRFPGRVDTGRSPTTTYPEPAAE
jgi:hypothetical protein